jgi:hypothetical protein
VQRGKWQDQLVPLPAYPEHVQQGPHIEGRKIHAYNREDVSLVDEFPPQEATFVSLLML